MSRVQWGSRNWHSHGSDTATPCQVPVSSALGSLIVVRVCRHESSCLKITIPEEQVSASEMRTKAVECSAFDRKKIIAGQFTS